MGKARRWKPKYLASKLRRIRLDLGLSQTEMASRLGVADRIPREDISTFERGKREPPLPVLLRYARLIKSSVDVLIDDELDLPE
jgi:transcriptional regulator with XRE-family HTH domain